MEARQHEATTLARQHHAEQWGHAWLQRELSLPLPGCWMNPALPGCWMMNPVQKQQDLFVARACTPETRQRLVTLAWWHHTEQWGQT